MTLGSANEDAADRSAGCATDPNGLSATKSPNIGEQTYRRCNHNITKVSSLQHQ